MGKGTSKAGGAGGSVKNDYDIDALEYYKEDGYYINGILRGGDELDGREQDYVKALDKMTNMDTVGQDELYRIVDAKTVFQGIDDFDYYDISSHLLFGDSAYDKGQYSQNKKARMQKIIDNVAGNTMTDKGFMSTTTDKGTAMHKVREDDTHGTNRIVLRITNAKGQKGCDMRFLDKKSKYVDSGPEKEFLLGRGKTYSYGKPYAKDGVIFVDVKLK